MGQVKEQSRMSPDMGVRKSAIQCSLVNTLSLIFLRYKMRTISCTYGVWMIQYFVTYKELCKYKEDYSRVSLTLLLIIF